MNVWRTSEQKVWRFQGFTSGSSKIFLYGSGYIIQPLPFQICKTGRNSLRQSAGKLNSFTVIKTTEIPREKPHRIFLLPHIQELIFSLPGQFEPLSVIHCSTKHSKTQTCVLDSRNKDFKVLFHSSEELLNTITVVICDSVVKSEEKVFVNCWHNKINFSSLNFFSSLLWALMQCYWLALLKCQFAFLILNFSLNVISNCYCQTRECNLVLLKENPFLISSPVLPPFGQGWVFNTAHVLCSQEDGNAYLEAKHSCFIYV